jgi:hypothetical protein
LLLLLLDGVLLDEVEGARPTVLFPLDASLTMLPPLTLSEATLLAVESSSRSLRSSNWPVSVERVFQSHSLPCESHRAFHPAPMPSTADLGSSSSRNRSQSQYRYFSSQYIVTKSASSTTIVCIVRPLSRSCKVGLAALSRNEEVISVAKYSDRRTSMSEWA